METWLVCARENESRRLAQELRRVNPQANIHVTTNPFALRAELAASHERCSVLVGEPCSGVEAVNLAAAVAEDGNARQVVLAVNGLSGSLRSRAAKAGVTRVVDLSGGLAELVGNMRPLKLRLGETVPQIEEDEEVHMNRGSLRDSEESLAPVVCFVSGRGGVGKTTMVAMAAATAASWGMNVACLDLDLAFGNLFSAFGLDGPADLSELALYASGRAGALRREDVVPVGKEALSGVELWGSCDLPEHAELVEPVVGDLIRHLCCGHDLVLIDSSPAWTDATALAVQVSDRLVLVSDETSGGTGSLSKAAALAVRLGVTRSRIVRVTNRCERRRDEEETLLRANVGLETARFYRLPISADVSELTGLGRIADLVGDGSDYASSVASFMAKTLEELGALPDVGTATEALAWREHKTRSWPFGR